MGPTPVDDPISVSPETPLEPPFCVERDARDALPAGTCLVVEEVIGQPSRQDEGRAEGRGRIVVPESTYM